MALLPQDPKDQYKMLGVIVILALGAAYYLYLWSPRGQELTELEQRIEQVEQANALAVARTENLDEVREELELGERQFAMLERLVPAESEVPAIYEAIASESQSLGLELVNVTPTDPVADPEGYFMRQNWGMQIEGEYHDVGRFLTRVASFSRIVRPEVLDVSPVRVTNAGRQIVSARFDLDTYVLPPEGGVETEPEGGS